MVRALNPLYACAFAQVLLIIALPQVSIPNLSISTRNCQRGGTNVSNWPLDAAHTK
jgi:hypothetical protein